jgi:large subunit ribosomal protein L3
MINNLMGIKLGMTTLFSEHGDMIPVTLIQAGPCPIVRIKNKETDGYVAVQLAYGTVKEKNVNKPLAGYFKKYNIKPHRWLKEFRIDSIDGIQQGQEIKVDIFSEGDLVNVSGITKGKGFQGVVKRHNFGGGPRTHGQSDRQRAPGAIGSQRPQRVKKGTRMAGHMGHVWRTIRNLEVIKVFPEKNLIAVKGSAPGPNNSLVILTKTKKKITHKVVPTAVKKERIKTKGKPPKEAPKKK